MGHYGFGPSENMPGYACDNCGCHEAQRTYGGNQLCIDCLLQARGYKLSIHGGTPIPGGGPEDCMECQEEES